MATAPRSSTRRATTSRRSNASRTRSSRAVLREVEPGSSVDCIHCGERVKFQAKVRNKQVICNVYERSVWLRVEHYHDRCYTKAKQPHGPVDRTPVTKVRRNQAATG
jgi:hypothetical protein